MSSCPARSSPQTKYPRLTLGGGWRVGARSAGILGALLVCLVSSGFADDEESPEATPTNLLKRMSVEELLNQEVMSVSRKPETWGQAASNVFLIRDQTVQAIGALTLPDLLRMAPTLFVAQASSSQWAVNARGFVRTNAQSNKLLVMIDGRTAYSPLFSNVFWDATSVFLPDLAQIEVISGPAGATWGANAVNGVISIQSKSAHDTLGGLVFGSTGTAQNSGGVRYGTKFGRDGALRVYGQRSDTSSTLSNTGEDDEQDAWDFTQGGFRADWGDNARGVFTVQGDVFAGVYQNGALPDTHNDGANLLGRWSRDLGADAQVWLRAYHDYSERDTLSLITETTHTSDVEFQHRFIFAGNQELLWGANYRYISDEIRDTVGFAILPADLDFALGGVFAQHQIVFAGEQLRLTTGLRQEHNHFSGWETQPSVRLAWQRDGYTTWLSASRAHRIPSRLDSDFFAPAEPPYLINGGPEFTSEVLDAFELGWRGQPAKNAALTATFFHHNYDRLRSVEPNGALVLPYTIGNLVAGHSTGLEVFADWDVNEWWRLRLGGFVMNQSTHLAAGGADLEGAQGEASFPEYQMQFRNTFRFGKSVTLWLGLRHVAEVSASESGGGSVPAYTELDANFSWRFRPEWEFTLTARNLFDPSHPEIGGLDLRREIRRSVQLGACWKF